MRSCVFQMLLSVCVYHCNSKTVLAILRLMPQNHVMFKVCSICSLLAYGGPCGSMHRYASQPHFGFRFALAGITKTSCKPITPKTMLYFSRMMSENTEILQRCWYHATLKFQQNEGQLLLEKESRMIRYSMLSVPIVIWHTLTIAITPSRLSINADHASVHKIRSNNVEFPQIDQMHHEAAPQL